MPKKAASKKAAQKRRRSASSSSSSSTSSNSASSGSSSVDSQIGAMIPSRSRGIYEKTFKAFMATITGNRVPTERDVFDYIHGLSQELSYKTLWTRFSIIKSMIDVHHQGNSNNYARVTAYLKRREDEGEPVKKAKIFTTDDIQRLLKHVPDDDRALLHLAFFFLWVLWWPAQQGELQLDKGKLVA